MQATMVVEVMATTGLYFLIPTALLLPMISSMNIAIFKLISEYFEEKLFNSINLMF